MAAAIQAQDLHSQAHIHNAIGDVHHAQGKFARALEAFQQASTPTPCPSPGLYP